MWNSTTVDYVFPCREGIWDEPCFALESQKPRI